MVWGRQVRRARATLRQHLLGIAASILMGRGWVGLGLAERVGCWGRGTLAILLWP